MEVPMRLILLGAPGAGKGTQAVALSKKLNIPHISTGDIFRSNIKKGTELGKKAKEYIDKGALVPDDVTIGIVSERLAQKDCESGFILDGFPRTIPQAESLDKVLENMGLDIDYVINIQVADCDIVERLSGRRVCKDCGCTYHIHNHPTTKEGICDICNAPVITRKDDREETVLNRLKTYHMQTEPLIEYYKQKGKLLEVEGTKPSEETTNELLEMLGAVK
jgi:adenylate kinase